MRKLFLVLLISPLFYNHSTSSAREGNFVTADLHKLSLQKPLNTPQMAHIELAESVYVAPVVVAPVVPVITDIVDCGTDPYMALIYKEESGCSTTRTNSIGCIGLGQSCPGSKILAVCPTLDWTCENNWFTAYAVARYGSPAQAWTFHLANNWW